MSMENAILAHGEALRELAAAIKEMNAGRGAALALPVEQGGSGQVTFGAAGEQAPDDAVKAKASTVKKDAELDKAVSKVEDDAKKPATGATDSTTDRAPADEADAGLVDETDAAQGIEGDALLNYAKDVKPVLLQVIKANKKPEVQALFAKMGVANGDQLTPAQLPGVLAWARKQLAA